MCAGCATPIAPLISKPRTEKRPNSKKGLRQNKTLTEDLESLIFDLLPAGSLLA